MSKTVSSINFSVYGTRELQAHMETIEPRVREAIFKRAIKPALVAMQSDAKNNALAVPVLNATGRVRSAIASHIKIITKGKSGSRYKTIGRLAVFYGVSGKERASQSSLSRGLLASLAHLIEYGYTLRYYFGKPIRPRAIEPRPFLRPAFKANQAAAEQMFLSAVYDACEAESKYLVNRNP